MTTFEKIDQKIDHIDRNKVPYFFLAAAILMGGKALVDEFSSVPAVPATQTESRAVSAPIPAAPSPIK